MSRKTFSTTLFKLAQFSQNLYRAVRDMLVATLQLRARANSMRGFLFHLNSMRERYKYQGLSISSKPMLLDFAWSLLLVDAWRSVAGIEPVLIFLSVRQGQAMIHYQVKESLHLHLSILFHDLRTIAGWMKTGERSDIVPVRPSHKSACVLSRHQVAMV